MVSDPDRRLSPSRDRSRRRYRPIRCAGRGAPEGACHVWPIGVCELIGLADAGFILPPQLYLDAFREPRNGCFAKFGGEVVFCKASTASSFCANDRAAAPRSIGEAENALNSRPTVVSSSEMANGVACKSQSARSLSTPAHDAVDRSGPGRPRQRRGYVRQCAAVIGMLSFEGAPGDFPSTSPSGPRALKCSTQSRMIRPTPPIRERIRPAATIVDLGQRQQTTALGRVPGPLREACSETLGKIAVCRYAGAFRWLESSTRFPWTELA